MDIKHNKIPLHRAILSILLSVLLVCSCWTIGLIYYKHLKAKKYDDPAYHIVAIIQSTTDTEKLKNVYLAEILHLSIDVPVNIYRFNTEKAKQILHQSPVIKQANVHKIPPGTIYIEYSLRQPVAMIGDISNAAIDVEGVLFPFQPFFSPKKLPIIYLGNIEPGIHWGTKLKSQQLELVFSIIQASKESFPLLRHIDVSHAFAKSYGQRQIVLLIENHETKLMNHEPIFCVFPHLLRLSTDHYSQQLKNYPILRDYLLEQNSEKKTIALDKKSIWRDRTTIIDMRIPELAYIREN